MFFFLKEFVNSYNRFFNLILFNLLFFCILVLKYILVDRLVIFSLDDVVFNLESVIVCFLDDRFGKL